MTTTAIPAAPVRGWDRTAIALLGSAGCALSYDALQQMATAIHVRGLLAYLFPLVIDGFIAYGVRALLVLRAAPFAARLYVWTLFGTATAASVWANALHAVRLNQQLASGGGLRLGDTTVGILSTIAPLALAGAVHLYILIARHNGGQPTVADHQPSADTAEPSPAPLPEQTWAASVPAASDVPLDVAVRAKPTGRPPGATMDQLLAVARPAVAEGGLTRAVVEQAVRAAELPMAASRFTQLMNHLRDEYADQEPDDARAHPALD
jgi:hypothetical protein